jgi:hypothetical protein
MPSGLASELNAKSRPKLAAAHITVSIENTAERAVSNLPVTARVVKNLPQMAALADLIAMHAIGILVAPATLMRAGPKQLAPTYAATTCIIIISPGPIVSCSHDSNHDFGTCFNYLNLPNYYAHCYLTIIYLLPMMIGFVLPHSTVSNIIYPFKF